MFRYSIVFLLIIGVSCHAWAQDISFSATPSANKIGVNDPLQITFTISNVNGLKDFHPQGFGDFTPLQAPYREQSMSVGSGGSSSSFSFIYLVKPNHEGTITIPPAIAKDASGHTYQSNAITVQVVPGSLAPQRQAARRNPMDDQMAAMLKQMDALDQQMNQQIQQQQRQMMQQRQRETPADIDEQIKKNLYIKVSFDKQKVHVGEQVTATYKIYSMFTMRLDNVTKLPSLNGSWTQALDMPKQAQQTEEIINGKRWMVLTIFKSAVFPQQTGELTLDPLEANASVMTSYGPRGIHLLSNVAKINVSALPEKNKPADYGGGVGNFSIAAKIDKQELTTDDIATLTININGSGNLKLMEAPKPDLPNGISTYDPQIADTITGKTGLVCGSKIITYAITPHTPGDYEIPGISLSYFNPQSGKYVTEVTQPLKLHVKQGKHISPVVTTSSNSNTVALKGDINDISKQPLTKISPASRPLPLTVGYWSAYALPLLAFIGIIGWRKREEELSKNTVLLRSKKANKIALQRLVTAKKLLDQQSKTPFYEEVSKAIWLYLSYKMNIPLSLLSRDTARLAMNERNVPEPLQKNLENVIWECETALYASGGSQQMANTYQEAIKVISDLEDVFKA